MVLLIALLTIGSWVVILSHRAVAPQTDVTTQPAQPTQPARPAQSTQPAQSTPAATTPQQPADDIFDKRQYAIDDPASPWVVVNKQRPLQPKTYAPGDLVSIGGGRQLRRAAAEALQTMLTAAKTAGYTVTAASAYRSYDRQVVIYNSEVKAYGQTVADTQSARPGTSEHQTGWAVDLASGGCSITDCFGTTSGGKWVTDHAAEYGFILRYTAGKQAITGYRAEAWHFRYVGKALAEEMKKQHIVTLEEFFGLPAAPDYSEN